MQNSIMYTEYDISHDRDRAEEMIRISGQEYTPVITIGSEVVAGFNEHRLVELLEKQSG